MAVDQEVAHVARIAAERQDRVDVELLRQNDARRGLDRVVKAQCRAKMRIEALERPRLRPPGIENREDMGDASPAVAVELVKAANGQRGKGKGLHARTPIMKGERAASRPFSRPMACSARRLAPWVKPWSGGVPYSQSWPAAPAGPGSRFWLSSSGLSPLFRRPAGLDADDRADGRRQELRTGRRAAQEHSARGRRRGDRIRRRELLLNDGVDWGALHKVLGGAGENGPSRGASTITMQTAKNLFLWPSRSVVRKGLEIGMALVLGKAWSKARTLEIYLNIAEWGDGLYGIEAAARRYFHKSASELDAREAALLATALPDPIDAIPPVRRPSIAASPPASKRRSATAPNCSIACRDRSSSLHRGSATACERRNSQGAAMVMKHLFVVIRTYGPPYARDLPLEEQQDWEPHRAFMNALQADGLVLLGGPLEEREDVLLILRARNKAEIERRLARDPWTKSGILSTTRISRWNLRIGRVA